MTLFGANLDWRFLLLAGALIATIAAITGVYVVRDQKIVNAVAVVDITGSMNTRDMGTPSGSQNRLDSARQALVDLLQSIPCQSRLGLGVFTERLSFLLFNPVEICRNYDALKGAISGLDWRMAWEGDSQVAKGLYSAVSIASSLKSDLIFLTDGHEAPPLPASGVSPFEGEHGGVKGLLVGVGGTEKSPIPKFDNEGHQVGVYGATDVPQDNRIGAPPANAEQREGYNPRNAPFGAMPTTGDEHLSSVKTAHLEDLAQRTGLTYVELQKVRLLSKPLLESASARVVSTSTNMAYVPALIALLLTILLYGLNALSGRHLFAARARKIALNNKLEL